MRRAARPLARASRPARRPPRRCRTPRGRRRTDRPRTGARRRSWPCSRIIAASASREQDRRAPEAPARQGVRERAEQAEPEEDRHRAVVLQERQVLAAERLQQRRGHRRLLADGLDHQRVRQEVRAVRHREHAERHDGQERGGADRDGAQQLTADEESEAGQADQEEPFVPRRAEQRAEDAQRDRAASDEPRTLRRVRQGLDRDRREPDRQEDVEGVLHPQQDHSGQRKRDDDSEERRRAQQRLRPQAGQGAVGDHQGADGEGDVQEKRGPLVDPRTRGRRRRDRTSTAGKRTRTRSGRGCSPRWSAPPTSWRRPCVCRRRPLRRSGGRPSTAARHAAPPPASPGTQRGTPAAARAASQRRRRGRAVTIACPRRAAWAHRPESYIATGPAAGLLVRRWRLQVEPSGELDEPPRRSQPRPQSRRLGSPQDLPGGRRRHGGIHHRAAARAGRPGHGCPERQAQHRGGRRRRDGEEQRRQERDREHRRPVRRRLRAGGRDLQEVPGRQAVQGLPRHAGRAEGHRRGHHRHTRSQPRRDRHGRHGAEEARLRAEAADPLRSTRPGS